MDHDQTPMDFIPYKAWDRLDDLFPVPEMGSERTFGSTNLFILLAKITHGSKLSFIRIDAAQYPFRQFRRRLGLF
jgi:hypothetical protein